MSNNQLGGRAHFNAIILGWLWFAALVALQPASAQTLGPASPETVNSEARYIELPGPAAGELRAIYIWRAPSTPGNQLLPTLYMADGEIGLYVAAARLRPAIERGLIPPVQIIGLVPDTRYRVSEYAEHGRGRYRAHERWVLETVIPWAERVARADPQRRAIGGYSNGAAFAIFMGADHPDIFSGVLAHSPVASAETFHPLPGRAGMRWAMSAGRGEYSGYPLAAIATVSAAALSQGGEVRLCRGAWGHDVDKWIELSPGSIAWLFRLEGADAVSSTLERETCR